MSDIYFLLSQCFSLTLFPSTGSRTAFDSLEPSYLVMFSNIPALFLGCIKVEERHEPNKEDLWGGTNLRERGHSILKIFVTQQSNCVSSETHNTVKGFLDLLIILITPAFCADQFQKGAKEKCLNFSFQNIHLLRFYELCIMYSIILTEVRIEVLINIKNDK